MGLGEILHGAGNWVGDLASAVSMAQMPWLHTDEILQKAEQDKAFQRQQAEHPSFFNVPAYAARSTVGNFGAVVGKALEPATHLPGWDQFMTGVDSGRRAVDTMLITTQHADVAAKKDGMGAGWGEMLNKDNWARAWNASSMDNHNRVTGGQIVATRLFGQNDRLELADPFAANDATAIQDSAQGTWYGQTTSALVDLGTSFIAPPGAGVAVRGAKAARLAKTVDSAATAERAAQRLAEVGPEGVKTGKVTVAQKAKDTLDILTPTRNQSVDSVLHRQMVGLRRLDGITDVSRMFDELKPSMENASDGAIANIADVFTEINRVPDATMRDKIRMNYFLSAHGSETARRALIEDAPLIARNFENLTTSPREAATVAELYSRRIAAGADDLPINEIVDQMYGTAADKAEMAALKDSLDVKRSEAAAAKALWDETKAAKPSIKNIDAEMLKRARNDSVNNATRLKSELAKAKDDLRGTKRWAAGSVKRGELGDVADFHAALGDARARVTELEQRLQQARSDRDLLHQTPLPGSQELAAWQADAAAAKGLLGEARANVDWETAFQRSHAETMKAKQAEINRLRPTLNRANDVLNKIFEVAGDSPSVTITGGAEPTLLQALKKNVTDRLGAEHYVLHGDGNTIVRVRSLPSRAARMALAPQARGSITLTEIGLGTRQLADTLARSRMFDPQEITQARNTLLRAAPKDRAAVVASYQKKMLARVAHDFYTKKGLDLSPEEAAQRAKELAAGLDKHFGKGNHWVSRAAGEQIKDRTVFVRDVDGEHIAFDEPMLRSHLGDNAPIFDPWDLKRILRDNEATLLGNARNGMHALTHAHDVLLHAWKVGALLRPGLMARSMLDTGPRMLASLSAAESTMAAMNGAANMIHNRSLTGLAKIHLSGKSPDEVAAQMRHLGFKPVVVKQAGKRIEHGFAKDNADLMVNLEAASKGQTVHSALFHDMSKSYNGLKVDRSKWARRKADSQYWALAYKEYAGMLMASPTARKLADMMTVKHAAETLDDVRRSIKQSPEFLSEYRQFGQPTGRTPEQFLSHLIHEVDLMFPSEKVLKAAKNGGLSEKLVDAEIPKSARFDIPSPEISALEGSKGAIAIKKSVDSMFRLLLDKPDMWLARNPTAVMLYNRAVKREYASLKKRFGGDYEVPAQMQEAIDRRAKAESIGYVRRTFFDTTRNTGAHRYAARVSPFFMAWEDAMMSWGRLIYDDPRRMVKLTAAYNAPFTVGYATGNPLVVNQDGQPIQRGDKAQSVFVQIPPVVFKPILKAMGQDPSNIHNYRARLDSINSIWQGETWWLPGVGPTVSAPAAWALGSGKVISRDAALDLVNTDNWMGQQILKSVFLGGEIPSSDPKTLASQAVPGWMRNLATETLGTGKIRNQQTTFNYLVAQAMQNGTPLTQETYASLWDRAGRAANAAAVTRLVAGGGLGLTGTAAVDGQFYADQLHIIQAMTPQMRGGLTADEFFSQKYPEAADLNWSITKNETGIVASVNASKAEARLGGMLRQPGNKDVGWMILGRDNMVDTEFSRTAYGIQRAEGNRTYLSSADAIQKSQAAVGWRQYNAWTQSALDMVKQVGLDENSDQYRAAKRVVSDYLKRTNPAWAKAFSERVDKFGYYYSQAERLAGSHQLKGRSDMVAFHDYDTTRKQVMKQFGIKSFSGTSPKYVAARSVMRQAGEQLAQKDLGFHQMWQRFLSAEVEEG